MSEPADPAQPRRSLYFVGARKRVELYRLIMRYQWKFYLGVVAVVIGIVALVHTESSDYLGIVLGVVGTVIGVVLMVPDVRALQKSTVDVQMLAPPEDYRPPISLRGGPGEIVRQPNKRTQRAVVYSDVDAVLATARTRYSVSDTSPGLPEDISAYRPQILRERLAGRDAFNGVIVGQISDLSVEALNSDRPVQLKLSRYFDLLLTNYMTNWTVVPGIGLPIFGWKFVIERADGTLKPLEGSPLSNAIGASTLGITTDRRTVLIGQSNRSFSSASMWAPAGSGSVDDRDLQLLKDEKSAGLVRVMTHAMERELQEEAHLSAGEIDTTYTTGYFRWINMGGKPEYTGVTFLRRSSEELKDRVRRRTEKKWVRRIVPDVPLDFELLRANPESPNCLPVTYRQSISFPLFMSLRALGVALDRDSRLRDRLL